MRTLLIGWVFTLTNSALLYVTAILVARWFGAAAYGDYAVAVASLTLFGGVATLGLGLSGLNILSVYRERAQWGLYYGYIRFSLILILICAILLGLSFLGGFSLYEKYFHTMERHVSRMICYFIPLAAVVYFLAKIMIIRKRFLVAMFIRRIQFPLQVLILLIIFDKLLPEFTLKYAVIAYGLSWLLCSISALVVFATAHRSGMMATKAEYKIRYWLLLTYPYLANTVILRALPYSALIMLELLYHSESETGYFAAVTRTTAFVVPIAKISDRYYLPELSTAHSRGDREGVTRVLRTRFRMIAGLAAVYGLIMIFFGKDILGLFGGAFEKEYFTLLILTGGMIVGILSSFSDSVMQVMGSRNLALALSLLMLSLTIALGLILIPPYGAQGAVLALVIPTVFVNLIQVIYLRRVHNVHVV